MLAMRLMAFDDATTPGIVSDECAQDRSRRAGARGATDQPSAFAKILDSVSPCCARLRSVRRSRRSCSRSGLGFAIKLHARAADDGRRAARRQQAVR